MSRLFYFLIFVLCIFLSFKEDNTTTILKTKKIEIVKISQKTKKNTEKKEFLINDTNKISNLITENKKEELIGSELVLALDTVLENKLVICNGEIQENKCIYIHNQKGCLTKQLFCDKNFVEPKNEELLFFMSSREIIEYQIDQERELNIALYGKDDFDRSFYNELENKLREIENTMEIK